MAAEAPSTASTTAGLLAPDQVFRVAPTTVPGGFNTVRVPLAPRATWLLDDIRFALDSSLITPDASEDFALIAAIRHDHPGAPLALFAHADQTGAEDYNKTLSGRRAIAVYATLTRRVDLWERLYSQPFGNDKWGEPALEMMRDATATPPMGGNSAAARAPLFQTYMDHLCRDLGGKTFKLDASLDFLARGADKDGKGDYQGCGEFNPTLVLSADEERTLSGAENKAARAEAHAPNRRVVGVFFEPGAVVETKRWPCPRATEGTAGCRKRLWSDAAKRRASGAARRTQESDGDTFACRFYDRFMHGEGHAVRARIDPLPLRLLDERGNPLAGEKYVFAVSGVRTSGVTNASGEIEVRVPSTAYEATLSFGGQLTRIELQPLPPATTVAGVKTRLRNLGYWHGTIDGAVDHDTRETVRHFQVDMCARGVKVPENGDPNDPATQRALVEFHGS